MSPRKRKFKKRSAFRRHKRRTPNAARTRLTFCENNAISESLYFELKRKGKGPREIELHGRIIITPEAERDWRAEREAETAERRGPPGRGGARLAPPNTPPGATAGAPPPPGPPLAP